MKRPKTKPRRRLVTGALPADGPWTEAAAQLVWGLPQLSPSAAVKARLLARVRAVQVPVAAGPGWHFSALDAPGGWVQVPFPGVRLRELTVDLERDLALVYVEMAPGAVFPDHVHAAKERGVVLSGDLQTGEKLLGAGEYYEADAGTRHERIRSASGCTGLLWVGARAWQRWRELLAEAGK